MEYNHIEAYCKMQYLCTSCLFQKMIWNSRDGVTPLSIKCSKCPDGKMTHMNYSHEERSPSHVPNDGDRIFIDITDDMKLKIAKSSIDRDKLYGTVYTEEEEKTAIKEFITSYFFDGCPATYVYKS